jgi:hypothetical protein
MRFDLSQPSTLRGIIWLGVGAMGAVMLMTGHKDDIQALVLLGGTVSGALGVMLDDNAK